MFWRDLSQHYIYDQYELKPVGTPPTLATIGTINTNVPLYDGEGQTLLLSDPAAVYSYVAANSANYARNSTDILSDTINNYRLQEIVQAGYVEGQYRIGDLYALLGVRYEITHQTIANYLPVPLNSTTNFEQVNTSSNYSKLLPSLNLSYDLTDMLKLRGAVTETLARPEYSQLAENSSATVNLSGGTASETISNPNLKPRSSTNFDLSAEWYWAPGALASVALFNKQIKNEIETLTTTTPNVTVPGSATPVDLTLTTSENAGNAVIQGVELSATDVKFGFLPGFLADFGVNANVAFIGFDAPNILMAGGVFRHLPQLLYSSKTIENAALLYSHGPFSGEIAFNYTSKMPISFDTNNAANDQWWHGISTVDAQVKYQIGDSWSVRVQGKNLFELSPAKGCRPDPRAQLLHPRKWSRHLSRRRSGILRGALRLAVAAAIFVAAAATAAPAHKLLVLSVDGLDWRYLRDRDAMGLRIPNFRRLLAEGEVADGVIGVWPTITWPSHTSIITGVRPDQHGILSNGRGPIDPSLSYWSATKLKVPALWQCAGEKGLSTAAVTWPVTMDARITYNLPEVFARRNGGSMDLETIAAHATPGLVSEISKAYPSFPQQWMDDRTRTQATLFLLKHKKPDLILLHLVDLDSEAHDQGPFALNANAILERTDELVGMLLAALPKDYDFALVSDHGFERIDHIANLKVQAAADGVSGDLEPLGGIITTKDANVAQWLRKLSQQAGGDVGREIPHDELMRYAPALADAIAAFEPADHVMFGRETTGPLHTPPFEKGEHGFWPLRHDYRSVFLLYGPGIKTERLPALEMISLEDRLAAPLGLSCSK